MSNLPPAVARNVLAPAKLNLFLHVTGRRVDGYHLLQSVFMLIDWCDVLHFETTANGHITRKDIGNTTGKALPEIDLSVRAAMALQAATGVNQGVHIQLDKQIPSEAGMGGGSSDAASTLLTLNQLWNTHLSLSELVAIGIQLGADVPFFLHQKHAWVEGIGEHISPIDLPLGRYWVIKPSSGVSTPAVFTSPDLVRDTKNATIADFAAWTELNALQQRCEQFGCNDLQAVAKALCPDIAHALNWLAKQGLAPRMTGSGSAVFAQIPDEFDLAAVPSLPAGWQSRLCTNKIS